MVFNSDTHTFELFLDAADLQQPSNELTDTTPADDRDPNDDTGDADDSVLHIADDDGTSYEDIFKDSSNSLKVLVAVASGVQKEDGSFIADFENNDFFAKSSKKKDFKPSATDIFDEVVRRKAHIKDTSKTSRQKKKSEHIKWLKENVNLSDLDKEWVIMKINWLRDIISKANLASKGPGRFINFRGDDWILRLLHAWFDFDNARGAMLCQNDALDRQELCGRNNEQARRVDGHKEIAANYNNQQWTALTTIHPALHPDFNDSVAISWNDVSSFGPIDAAKVKNKLTTMFCKLNIIKSNYEASGNGVGTRMAGQSDELLDPDDMPNLGGADDRMNFLGGESSTLLYLWEKSVENDMIETVLQRISTSVALNDGGDAASVSMSSGARKRKKAAAEEEARLLDKKIAEQIMRTSNHMRTYNIGFSRTRLHELKEKELDERDKLEDMETAGKVSRTRLQHQHQRVENARNEIVTLEKELRDLIEIEVTEGDECSD